MTHPQGIKGLEGVLSYHTSNLNDKNGKRHGLRTSHCLLIPPTLATLGSLLSFHPLILLTCFREPLDRATSSRWSRNWIRWLRPIRSAMSGHRKICESSAICLRVTCEQLEIICEKLESICEQLEYICEQLESICEQLESSGGLRVCDLRLIYE